MGFIKLFFKNKEEIKEKDIEQFISQKIEENSKLDYKDIKAYQEAEKLATHISSFANSEGGLLILGISQDEIKDETGKIVKIFPKKPTWGKFSLDKESLENRLITLIKPPIDELVIKPVQNKKNEVIFLIDIPRSPNAPHMATDHRYYKRINFRKRLMEHFEVANLFINNWTMKEKIIEKIYVPLSSILEKHAKELETLSYLSPHEVNDILAETYCKMQMPHDLLGQLDYYNSQVEALNKKEHYARRAMAAIFNKTVMKYLKKPVSPSYDFYKIELRAISNTGNKLDIQPQDILRLLLQNQKIENFLKETYWSETCEHISIRYSNESPKELELTEFDEEIWNKCLAEVAANSQVQQFKKNAKSLLEIIWSLIENITRY